MREIATGLCVLIETGGPKVYEVQSAPDGSPMPGMVVWNTYIPNSGAYCIMLGIVDYHRVDFGLIDRWRLKANMRAWRKSHEAKD